MPIPVKLVQPYSDTSPYELSECSLTDPTGPQPPTLVKIQSHDTLTWAGAPEVCGAKNRKFPISAATQPSAAPTRVKRMSCECALTIGIMVYT